MLLALSYPEVGQLFATPGGPLANHCVQLGLSHAAESAAPDQPPGHARLPSLVACHTDLWTDLRAQQHLPRLCDCSPPTPACPVFSPCCPCALQLYDELAKATKKDPAAAASNRPRALLLEGPPGTGKTTCARQAGSSHAACKQQNCFKRMLGMHSSPRMHWGLQSVQPLAFA